jgi:hypothetical protein
VCRPKKSRATIPKRGDKQFAPAEGGETGLQQTILQIARDAMFTTLATPRTINKYAIRLRRDGTLKAFSPAGLSAMGYGTHH